MSFFGDYKRARVINLGNASTVSAKELLEKNRRARQERLNTERQESAKLVLLRYFKRLLVRKKEFERLKGNLEIKDRISLYEFFFPFVSVQDWTTVLPLGSPSLKVVKKLVKYKELDHILYQVMKRDDIADFEFLGRFIEKNPDLRMEILEFAKRVAHIDRDAYIQYILTLQDVIPPQEIVHRVAQVLQNESIEHEQRVHLFVNVLRLDPSKDIASHIKIVYWGLVNLDLFQVYQLNQSDDEDAVIVDTLSSVDRLQIDKLGTLDYLRILLTFQDQADELIPIIGLILYRFENRKVELGSWLVFQNLYGYLWKSILEWTRTIGFGSIPPWHHILLFCDLDTRMLSTTSQEEFKTRNLQDVELFSGTIKDHVKDLMWDSVILVSTPSFGVPPITVIESDYDGDYKLSILTKWLSSIFTRDSLSPFCKPNHWLFNLEDLRSLLDAIPTFDLDESVVSTLSGIKIIRLKKILESIPFVIPFEERVYLFRKFVQLDQGNMGNAWMQPRLKARIRRPFVFEDGFSQLNGLSTQLRDRIAIEFIDDHGIREEGIDGGGVFKEFLVELLKKAFDTRLGLFISTKEGKLYPATTSYACQQEQLELFAFLGRMVGKALYEGVLVDRLFSRFFLSKWIGKRSYFHELPEMDSELYNGLMFLKKYDGNVEDLALTMSLTLDQFGTKEVVDLKPRGSHIGVTDKNRVEYIYLTAHYRLNTQLWKQCSAFFTGLTDLVHPDWLKMFNEEELQVLIGGLEVPIDPMNLKQFTTYGGVFDPQHPTIILFWQVVEEMTQDQLKLLIKFITSVPRPPLLGFGELQPPLCIRFGGQEEDRLPSASTCVNLLKLPAYQSKERLKEYF